MCVFSFGSTTFKVDVIFFFFFYITKSIGRCRIDSCEQKYKSFHSTTLRGHIAKRHSEVMNILLPPVKKHERYTDSLNAELRKHLVELTTACGRPTTLVEDEPMKTILGIAAGTHSASPNTNTAGTNTHTASSYSFNRKQLKADTQKVADAVRVKIANMLEGKPLSLYSVWKIDTWCNGSIHGC